MTFTTTTQIIDEDVLKTLSSSDGFLIGYTISIFPDKIFKSHHKCIKEITDMNKEDRRIAHDKEPIIMKLTISAKDTTFEDDYSAVRGEVIESEEYLQFDKHSRQWR